MPSTYSFNICCNFNFVVKLIILFAITIIN